jgi:DNA-directed RNA polymerase I, II, and III subunit RPABC5
MIPPVRCFTCGKLLCDKWAYYQEERAKMETAAAASPAGDANGALKFFDKAPTGKLLDRLGLTRMCCRRHMLTDVDLTDEIA